MEIINSIEVVRKKIKNYKKNNKIIGLVPTMGALHKGHISLIKKSKADCDITIVSIFVNPIQFGKNEDFNKYPKVIKNDVQILEKNKADILFYPATDEMYPEGINNHMTFVTVEKITDRLCGITRPGHFTGVTTIVTKLFNIIKPDIAYFGKKDFQQYVVINKMVRDLNFDIKIVPVNTVREKDGLAISSRNSYLNIQEKEIAPNFRKIILQAKAELLKNNVTIKTIIDSSIQELSKYFKVDYFNIVNPETFEDLNKTKRSMLIVSAVFLGKTRLIDNEMVEKKI